MQFMHDDCAEKGGAISEAHLRNAFAAVQTREDDRQKKKRVEQQDNARRKAEKAAPGLTPAFDDQVALALAREDGEDDIVESETAGEVAAKILNSAAEKIKRKNIPTFASEEVDVAAQVAAEQVAASIAAERVAASIAAEEKPVSLSSEDEFTDEQAADILQEGLQNREKILAENLQEVTSEEIAAMRRERIARQRAKAEEQQEVTSEEIAALRSERIARQLAKAEVTPPREEAPFDEDLAPPRLTPEELGDHISAAVFEENQIQQVLIGAQNDLAAAPQGMTGLHGLDICDPEKSILLQIQRLPEEDLVQCMQDQKVHFASGDSDDDSVRDYDSGPGKIQCHKRMPYTYRREIGAANVYYRRRIKLFVEDGSPNWRKMTDSDEEGGPKQESFVLSATLEQDAAGVPIGEKIETEELPFRTQAALLTIPGTKEEMDTPLLKAHLVNYSEVLVDRVTTHAKELPPLSGKEDDSVQTTMLADCKLAGVLEDLCITMRNGYGAPSAVCLRELTCPECTRGVFYGEDPEQGLDNEICRHCNAMVHSECAHAHLTNHIQDCICRGVVKRETSVKAQQELDADFGLDKFLSLKEPAVEPVEENAAVDVGAPVDPMAEFFQSRPKVTERQLENARKLDARREQQTESSGEEGLAPLLWCSTCGSVDWSRRQ